MGKNGKRDCSGMGNLRSQTIIPAKGVLNGSNKCAQLFADGGKIVSLPTLLN
jgi:hypothetical protein